MLTRRWLIAATLPAILLVSRGWAAADWTEVLREAIENEPDDPIFLGRQPLPPDDPRWTEAKSFMDSAPTDGRAVSVAQHFDNVVPDRFRKEWPAGYANPLIVLFYAATKTKPSGDVTPWCAAFMSWCIERVQIASPHSASSRDYRSFGTARWEKGSPLPGDAKEGDVAVFKSLSNPSNGHVTFFLGVDPKAQARIRGLGGNQSDQIGVTSFRINANLELQSIRAVD
jgi:uncharacterized protein (TIGR02594 family)